MFIATSLFRQHRHRHRQHRHRVTRDIVFCQNTPRYDPLLDTPLLEIPPF